MTLPERFAIHITGTVARARTRHLIAQGGLPHLFAHLLSGGVVPASAWAAFGLRVSVEEDTDQGDEGEIIPTVTSSSST